MLDVVLLTNAAVDVDVNVKRGGGGSTFVVKRVRHAEEVMVYDASKGKYCRRDDAAALLANKEILGISCPPPRGGETMECVAATFRLVTSVFRRGSVQRDYPVSLMLHEHKVPAEGYKATIEVYTSTTSLPQAAGSDPEETQMQNLRCEARAHCARHNMRITELMLRVLRLERLLDERPRRERDDASRSIAKRDVHIKLLERLTAVQRTIGETYDLMHQHRRLDNETRLLAQKQRRFEEGRREADAEKRRRGERHVAERKVEEVREELTKKIDPFLAVPRTVPRSTTPPPCETPQSSDSPPVALSLKRPWCPEERQEESDRDKAPKPTKKTFRGRRRKAPANTTDGAPDSAPDAAPP